MGLNGTVQCRQFEFVTELAAMGGKELEVGGLDIVF